MTYAAEIVMHFVREVRSGRDPDAAFRYLAPQVMAQEVRAEGVLSLVHTPVTFSAYVRKLLELYGNYTLHVEDLIAQNDRVFVRWTQRGWHCGSINGEEPTGKPLIEMSSAVYRVEAGVIVEYCLQTDRKGLEIQLDRISETMLD
jgi:predicted ester cyclase